MLDISRRQFLSYSASGLALAAAGEVVGAGITCRHGRRGRLIGQQFVASFSILG